MRALPCASVSAAQLSSMNMFENPAAQWTFGQVEICAPSTGAPSGPSTVVFRYVPRAFRRGVPISIVSQLVVLGLAVSGWLPDRSDRSDRRGRPGKATPPVPPAPAGSDAPPPATPV